MRRKREALGWIYIFLSFLIELSWVEMEIEMRWAYHEAKRGSKGENDKKVRGQLRVWNYVMTSEGLGLLS